MKISQAALQVHGLIVAQAQASLSRILRDTVISVQTANPQSLDLKMQDKQAHRQLQQALGNAPQNQHKTICIDTLGFVADGMRTIRDFNVAKATPSMRLRYGTASLMQFVDNMRNA